MSEHAFLSQYRLVLASGSPRRRAILQQVGIVADVIPSKFEENLPKSSFPSPVEYVTATARGKACDVFSEHQDAVVIGADTVVVIDGKILEKPRDVQCARDMLGELSGQTPHVITGVWVCYKEKQVMFHVESEVKIADLSPEFIEWYVDTGEPMDKAGAFGIQGKGALLVEKVHGCYFNVMGLPIQRLFTELKNLLM